MKNNKGFLGTGILIAIIAVLVVGGGAYYFGTKHVSAPEKIEENNYQSAENQNVATTSNISAQNTLSGEAINSTIKSNIESYMATVNYKPTVSGNVSACSSILYGRENNYAYAWVFCGEYDKELKLGTASSLSVRAEINSNYKVIEIKEALDGEDNQDYHKQIFGKFYNALILKHPSNQEADALQQDALNKAKSYISSEDSSTETFKNQPGKIISLTPELGIRWVLAIDLLSRNPNWVPGDSSTGGLFINQNTKIRNLIATRETKMYKCGSGSDGNGPMPNVLVNPEDFINDIVLHDYKIRYFDINGINITAIYEQCLP